MVENENINIIEINDEKVEDTTILPIIYKIDDIIEQPPIMYKVEDIIDSELPKDDMNLPLDNENFVCKIYQSKVDKTMIDRQDEKYK